MTSYRCGDLHDSGAASSPPIQVFGNSSRSVQGRQQGGFQSIVETFSSAVRKCPATEIFINTSAAPLITPEEVSSLTKDRRQGLLLIDLDHGMDF
jgi:hypothetical protein